MNLKAYLFSCINLNKLLLANILFTSILTSFSEVTYAQNPNPNSTIDNYISNEMNSEKIPGMSTLIVKNGEIVWKQSYGFADVANNTPVNDDSIFLLASLSKIFTGTALMKLYEDGLIDLDDAINSYLPYSINNPIHTTTPISFRMLMTHTSSIADNGSVMDTYYSIGDPTITLADVMERYFSPLGTDYNATENFSTNAPGTAYDYSNMGTALAGYLVEVISGTPFNEYCNNNIFNKLCMEDTAWHLADLDISRVAKPYEWVTNQYTPFDHYGFADYPNGQLRSSINDLANFTIAYLQNGSFHSEQLLNISSINEMLTIQVPSIDTTQGLNWYLEQINLTSGGTVSVWGHNGGENGVSTDLYINTNNQIGVVVISNSEGSNQNVIDRLYNYGLSLSTSGVGNPPCSALSIQDSQTNTQALQIYQSSHEGEFILVSNKDKIQELIVHSNLGQRILHKTINSITTTFSLDHQGLYFVSVITKNGVKSTSKIIRK